MRMWNWLISAAILAALAMPVQAKTLRWVGERDV